MVDVESMYEMASDVLKLEGALNLITFGAVLVLFFIILIGVINTLRMTIRERTREIGTVRAIGMQKKDVRNSFILETMFLGLFSAIAGTGLLFWPCSGFHILKFHAEDNPSQHVACQQSFELCPVDRRDGLLYSAYRDNCHGHRFLPRAAGGEDVGGRRVEAF